MYKEGEWERILRERIDELHKRWKKQRKKKSSRAYKRKAHRHYIKKELRRAQ